MAGLWWMTVMLVFFPSVGSLDAVNQKNLAELIQAIKEKYKLEGTKFSLALSIQNEDPKNLEEQIYTENPEEEVNKQLSKGAVYEGKRLAVAKVEKPEDGALRVLQHLRIESNDGELLVIYSQASPCPSTCTDVKSPDNIIQEINCVINHGKWSNYIFVFEDVFKPKVKFYHNENKILRKALADLGKSRIPLANIFRCFKSQNIHDHFQCTSCSSGGKVDDKCIK